MPARQHRRTGTPLLQPQAPSAAPARAPAWRAPSPIKGPTGRTCPRPPRSSPGWAGTTARRRAGSSTPEGGRRRRWRRGGGDVGGDSERRWGFLWDVTKRGKEEEERQKKQQRRRTDSTCNHWARGDGVCCVSIAKIQIFSFLFFYDHGIVDMKCLYINIYIFKTKIFFIRIRYES